MTILFRQHAMLVVSTAAFAVLALDIAYPAMVLSIMAAMRWVVPELYPAPTRELAA
ncbi:hypothetical protein N7E02_23635 [Aliirhizobium terrae]|uniref:hypothetical protein n=1 Tax=Terrirhizobium terrae TaxID=2926709 RepID=UPI0025785C11|nr:hypothetical protein [Rhizobium sp. CC-CFT758]WJH39713.1 hypothetical protein N7E02_23635 [Rhizobium sp. CC-CFT758]